MLRSLVLARLPDADQKRAAIRRRQRNWRLAVVALALLGLGISIGPASPGAITQVLAGSLAADAAWNTLVRVLLGGLAFLPALSAGCMCLGACLLWFLLVRTRAGDAAVITHDA